MPDETKKCPDCEAELGVSETVCPSCQCDLEAITEESIASVTRIQRIAAKREQKRKEQEEKERKEKEAQAPPAPAKKKSLLHSLGRRK